MYARVATFQGGDVDEIRRINNEMLVNDPSKMPAGIKRVMVLEGDQRLVISFFDRREDLDASEEKWERLGDEISESARGKRVGLATYQLIFEMEAAH